MKIKALSLFATLLFTLTASAQFTWSDIGAGVDITALSNGGGGTTTVGGVTNPNSDANPLGENLTLTTNRFVKDASSASYVKISLPIPILAADIPSTIIKVKIYFAEFDDLPNTSLKMFLRDTGNGNADRKTDILTFDEADEGIWKEYEFDFSGATGNFNDEYNEAQLFFNLGNSVDTATYYFDVITSNVDQEYTLSPAASVLDANNDWYYNYSPDTFGVSFTNSGGNSVLATTSQSTPSLTGNDSPFVAKFTKDTPSASGFIKYTFPTEIFEANQANAIFKVRVYVPATASGSSLRMNIRKTGQSAGTTQITTTITNANIVEGRWEEYTFDFSAITFKHTSYDHALMFIMDTGDTSGAGTNDYYFDALQGPSASVLATNEHSINSTYLNIYPTLVDNTFTISKDIISAEVYNIASQKVKTYGNQSHFDASNLVSGVYFFHATLSNGTSQIIRFVKK